MNTPINMKEIGLVLEHHEAVTQQDLYNAAPEATRKRMGFQLMETNSALVSLASNEPNILINRAIGLGMIKPATEDEVIAIREHYKKAGIERFFLHLHPQAQPQELRQWILNNGYSKARGWMSFYRDNSPPPDVNTELTVKSIGPEHATDFARIAANAFDLSENTHPMIAALVGRPNWHLYMSFAGESPAGTGAMYVKEGVAWFSFGATDPAFRQRGSQGAVLQQRIKDAIKLGCHLMVTATGESVEGDPQHSYKNILRFGFKTAELIENFVPTNEQP